MDDAYRDDPELLRERYEALLVALAWAAKRGLTLTRDRVLIRGGRLVFTNGEGENIATQLIAEHRKSAQQ